MNIIATCPACGFVSPDIRCPRCNALKVQGCSGMCATCASACKIDALPATSGAPAVTPSRPSEAAAEDDEHPGTPLKR